MNTEVQDTGGEHLACRLIGKEFAERKEQLSRELFGQVLETTEHPDGYAFRFTAEGSVPQQVLAFIEEERQCCPFFLFELRFEPNNGPLWLRIGGSAQAKAFLADELGELLVTT